MRAIRWTAWASTMACALLVSCSPTPRAVVRNDSGADVALWPLSGYPVPLKAGETTRPMVFSAYEPHQAMLQRGDCLYTYQAPVYSALPKRLRSYASAVVIVIRPDMKLAAYERSNKGVQGAEIVVGGFPLTPTTFCGRSG